ncbi:MAG: phosphodiester glycosidase family protein [Verrucomicrobia bacterium]|nr:phosphodiester glycosidase family protein [Verrucomicrobiota bacterium]
MRFLLFFLIFVVSLQAAPSERWHLVKSKELGSLSGGVTLKSVTLREGSNPPQEAVVTAIVFSEKNVQLQVVDNPARDKTLAQVMKEEHFLAGVNGGYFRLDGKPMGLVISGRKTIHAQETAPRLLSGFVVGSEKKLQLVHVGEKMPSRATEVLQAGPFLINHQAPVIGLETRRIARRTFVATDGHGAWMLGVISPVTLAEAARVLLAAAPRFLPVYPLERALNLDGGSSSALWVDLTPEPFSQSEIGMVRNFLGIKFTQNISE